MANAPETVEIKVTVSDDQVRHAAREFALAGEDAQTREIWFCESKVGLQAHSLALLDRGIILRLRKISDDPDDATLKLRGPTLPLLSPDFDFEVQGDWAGEQQMLSASIVAKRSAEQLREAVSDGGDLRRGFTAVQLEYLQRECDPPVDVRSLKALGPIQALKWSSITLPRFPHEIRAEQWKVQDLRFLEFSIEVGRPQAEEAQIALHEQLVKKGLKIAARQSPKTTLVLQRLAGIADR